MDVGSLERELATGFDPLFARFDSVTVAVAMKVRPEIVVDPTYAASQVGWCVHKKWIEELCDLRSKSAHKGTHAGRKWA